RSSQRPTCPRQPPLRGQAPGPVSGQLSADHPGGGPGAATCGFLLPFSRRHSLLGHPVPPEEFRPHYCRPTATGAHTRTPAADPGRVYTFHTRETQTGPGALYTPGITVFAGHRSLRSRRLPPLNGRSLAPRTYYPTRDVLLTRHQQEFPDTRPIPRGRPPGEAPGDPGPDPATPSRTGRARFPSIRLSSDYCVGTAVGCPSWMAVWQVAQTTRVFLRRLAISWSQTGCGCPGRC